MTLEVALLAWLPVIADLESLSCRVPVQDLHRPAIERSYGCYGVRLVAYHDAVKFDPTLPRLSDQQAIKRLRDDRKFNRRVATITLKRLMSNPRLRKHDQDDVCVVLSAYNMGSSGMQKWMRDNGRDLACETKYMRALQQRAKERRK